MLLGIARQEALSKTLVFKGGTALKKFFFGEYRFSEDLDFTAVGAPHDDNLETLLKRAVASTSDALSLQGAFALDMERYLERDPHPHGQEAFVVRFKFPWQPQALCRIKIEISHDEAMMLEPEERPIIHGYEEIMDIKCRCYRIEEIFIEKLRTLLQTAKSIRKRGWHRPRARDYYDLWSILKTFGDDIERDGLAELLNRKAAHGNVSFNSVDDFFTEELVAEAHRSWQSNLGKFTRDLPKCDLVIEELISMLPKYIPEIAHPMRGK